MYHIGSKNSILSGKFSISTHFYGDLGKLMFIISSDFQCLAF